jgi:hypothetical protein
MITQTFSNVTPERWGDIKAMFSQETGVQITADKGATQDSHNIHFAWAYGGDALAVTVISVPWYLPVKENGVMARFTTWINGVQ